MDLLADGVEVATVCNGTNGQTPVITAQDATTCGVAGGKDVLVNGEVLTTVCNGATPRILLVTAAWAQANAGTAPGSVVDVASDGAPGFEAGSIQATGAAKAELYFRPSDLFPSHPTVTLGDIARVSFWTKKSATHAVQPDDWYMNIYTKKYAAQTSGWYGARISTVPYTAANLQETAGAWNQWSTDGQANQLRFFESAGVYESYSDPFWSAFVTGTSPNGSGAYAAQEVLYFSAQTNSLAVGLDPQLDGVRIELKDGTVAELDMQ
jgi:hypothetical protein